MAKKKKDSIPTAVAATAAKAGYVAPRAETAQPEAPKSAPVVVSAVPVPTLVVEAAKVYSANTATPPQGNGRDAVTVRFDSTDGQADMLRATIVYRGALATTGRITARLGLECSGRPRWQQVRDVEMRQVKEGMFEADVTLPRKDDAGADLMALQLAFQSPVVQAWDNAGSQFGYYQVSALTGAVESVQQ